MLQQHKRKNNISPWDLPLVNLLKGLHSRVGVCVPHPWRRVPPHKFVHLSCCCCCCCCCCCYFIPVMTISSDSPKHILFFIILSLLQCPEYYLYKSCFTAVWHSLWFATNHACIRLQLHLVVVLNVGWLLIFRGLRDFCIKIIQLYRRPITHEAFLQ